MSTEAIRNSVNALTAGLRIANGCLMVYMMLYHMALIPELVKPKPPDLTDLMRVRKMMVVDLVIFGISVLCSAMMFFGVQAIGVLLFSPSAKFEQSSAYAPVALGLLSAVGALLVVFVAWTLFLIWRGGIWPSTWTKRVWRIMPSVTSFILLVTLLRALYWWFR